MKPEQVYNLINEMRKELKEDFEALEEKSEKIYVKVEAFDPVRKLVYGLVGIVLTSVMVALLGLVVLK
jgi:hypothetical protein